MREGVVIFHVKATARSARAIWLHAGYGDKSARQSVDVSVRPASAYRTQVDVGRVDAGKQVDLPDLRKMYDAYASRDAAISTLPVVLSQGLTSYLVNYQNYCSEQMVSGDAAAGAGEVAGGSRVRMPCSRLSVKSDQQ
jgi:uncharacterized protein YfaS (alpha-2-macroglobulin family)